MIDGTGAAPHADIDVVVRRGRIAELVAGGTAAVRARPGTRVLDARGKFLIPGLWDMHVHASRTSEAMLGLYVAHGITGVRDMGTDLDVIERWRGRIATGARAGPRIVAAGAILNGARLPLHVEVASASDARRVVDSLARRGVDFIKVHERISREAYLATAEQARQRGLPLAGHVPGALTAAEVSDAGQKSIEHLRGVPLPCSAEEVETLRPVIWQERLFGRCDTTDQGPLYARFAGNGTWHTPTFAVKHALLRASDSAAAAVPDPRLRYVPASLRALWKEVFPAIPPLPHATRVRLERLFLKHLEIVGAMHRAGVGILAGTDTPTPNVIPGWSLHDELVLLVDAGLTPMEALRAATSAPAAYLGLLDSVGTVETGKAADLVLLDADPLANIRNTQRIRAVVLRGRLFDGSARRDLLRRAALMAPRQ